jgi:hypothetical protein
MEIDSDCVRTVMKDVFTPISFVNTAGSTSLNKVGSMGACPCLDTTMMRVSSKRPFALSLLMMRPSDASANCRALSKSGEKARVPGTYPFVFCPTDTE